MKKFIIYLFLTILLWPLAIIILILKLRQSFTRYPKRLSLMDSVTIQCAVDRWFRKVNRLIPFGDRFWFVDKPKPPREHDDKFWEDFRKEQDVIKKRLKEEFGIE